MNEFKEVVSNVTFKVFPYHLTVIISNDIQESWKKRGKLLGDMPVKLKTATAFHLNTDTGYSMIFLNEEASNGVVAHESNHCVRSLMRHIGASYEEEVESYLLYYIVEAVHKALKKWRD